MSIRMVWALLAVMIGLLYLPPAFGYVLYGEHLIERMVHRLDSGAKGFVVREVIASEINPCDAIVDGDSEAQAKKGIAWYRPAGDFRAEVQSGKAQNIYVAASGEALTIIDGKIRGTAENNLLRYTAPLLYHEREPLVERMKAMGIDTTVSSLGRMGDTIVYVVGAEYPDETVSQLWLDRESFLPVRLMLVPSPQRTATHAAAPLAMHLSEGRNAGATIDIRYQNWARQNAIRYPMRILIHENSRLMRVICATGVERKDSFPDDFFDITTLKARYPMAETIGGGEAAAQPTDEADDVQQTIEDFKKLYQ
ncbi:MAG: hypothetical protein SWH68_09080 [Thermodesulfobacteriota bacterium]|nr:hypothetical protein [Thermodesulfobacteriota bacterium]